VIYFLKHPQTGRVKIGQTANYHQRLSSLIVEHGDLELIGIMEGNRDDEQNLHKRFSHLRAKDMPGREWFCLTGELSSYIYQNARFEAPDRLKFGAIRTTSLGKAAFDLFMTEEKIRRGNPNLEQAEVLEALFAEYKDGVYLKRARELQGDIQADKERD